MIIDQDTNFFTNDSKYDQHHDQQVIDNVLHLLQEVLTLSCVSKFMICSTNPRYIV